MQWNLRPSVHQLNLMMSVVIRQWSKGKKYIDKTMASKLSGPVKVQISSEQTVVWPQVVHTSHPKSVTQLKQLCKVEWSKPLWFWLKFGCKSRVNQLVNPKGNFWDLLCDYYILYIFHIKHALFAWVFFKQIVFVYLCESDEDRITFNTKFELKRWNLLWVYLLFPLTVLHVGCVPSIGVVNQQSQWKISSSNTSLSYEWGGIRLFLPKDCGMCQE